MSIFSLAYKSIRKCVSIVLGGGKSVESEMLVCC